MTEFRLEIDQVDRAHNERYDTFRSAVKEYDGALAEIKRLKVQMSELEKQVERTRGEIQAQENKAKLKEEQIRPLLDHFRHPADGRQQSTPQDSQEPIANQAAIDLATPSSPRSTVNTQEVVTQHRKTSKDPESTTGSRNTSTPVNGIGIGPKGRLQRPSASAFSPAPMTSTVLTDKAVLRIIEEVEEAHGHQFSPAEIKTIIEEYPHARFKNGNLYLRKCSYCQANAVAAKGSGSSGHFMQGDIAFIRHMRRHDLQSGLSGKSIDEHCIMGEPVSWDDVMSMSQGKEPNKLILINFGKGDAVYGGSTGSKADTKRRASALAVACDTNEAEAQEEEEQPKKRQRKSHSFFSAHGFVPINALDEYEEELYMS